jgi:hypothetical protein
MVKSPAGAVFSASVTFGELTVWFGIRTAMPRPFARSLIAAVPPTLVFCVSVKSLAAGGDSVPL